MISPSVFILASCALSAPALLPIGRALAMPRSSLSLAPAPIVQVSDRYDRQHYYHVNRYGYGHFVHRRDGGYGPYAAGSGAAFVYKQQHHWACEYAPSRC